MDETSFENKARIRVILETSRAMKRERNIARFKLRNEGHGKAENIIVSISPSNEFQIVGSPDRKMKVLDSGDSCSIEFLIRVKPESDDVKMTLGGTSSTNVDLTLRFVDMEGRDNLESSTHKIDFFLPPESQRIIKNPYVPGIPLKTPEMFYGREKLLKSIVNDFETTDRTHAFVLQGQRRTGKTSVLYQLKTLLGNRFIPILLDLQGMPDTGTDIFFYWMALKIQEELSKRDIIVQITDEERFLRRPAFYFGNIFLPEVRKKLGSRRLVLMMDEFEFVDVKIREGKIDRSVVDFMRSMIQHSSNIDFVFSTVHPAEEIASECWSILFNVTLYHRINFLERNEAIQLIREPLKGPVVYHSLSIDKILEMSAGHPYFVQLLCYHIINHQILEKNYYVTIDDVSEVLNEVVISASPHFEHIWEEMKWLSQLVLLTLAELVATQGVVTSSDVVSHLKRLSFKISEHQVNEILDELLRKGIVEGKMDAHYGFKIELIRLWCEKNKQLNRFLEGELHE